MRSPFEDPNVPFLCSKASTFRPFLRTFIYVADKKGRLRRRGVEITRKDDVTLTLGSKTPREHAYRLK